MTGRGRIRALARPLLAIGLLYVVFRFVPVAEVAGAIARARWSMLALALPLVLLGPVLSAARLRVLTDAQGMSLSLRQILGVNLIARFYGLVVPGHVAAGAVRWYRLVRLEDRKAEVLGAIVLARLVHLLALSGLGLGFFLLDPAGWSQPSGLAAAGLLAATTAAGLVVLARAEPEGLIGRLPAAGKARLRRFASTLARFRRMSGRDLARVVWLSSAEHLVATVVLYLLAIGLGLAVPFVSLGWVRAAVQVLALLPFSVSGLGIREGGMIVALEPYGVATSSAVALGLLVFATTVLVGAIGGLLELRASLSGGLRRPEEATAGEPSAGLAAPARRP